MQIIAHRGVSAHAPENTLAAFDMALEIDADSIETDVWVTKDGVPILSHDERTGRISSQDLVISESTYEELAKLDLGILFSPKFAGQRIVTLEEFLKRYCGRISLCLEMKAPHIEAQVAALLSNQKACDITITSFQYDILEKLRALDESLYLGYLVWDLDSEVFRRAEEQKFQQVCPNIQKLTQDALKMARLKGLCVRVWGVGSDISLMRKAIDMGVDGLTVDDVPMFMDVLERCQGTP